MSERIKYLDGLRGLAILLVIPFHAYVRWPEIVPYSNKYADISLFKFGWLGVNLFFLISGFVILMTLEKCTGIKEFIYRRWLRLFPAMLICSLLIYFTAGFFYERPAGVPESITNLLPGLLFIEPKFLIALGISKGLIEGAFWSLYVECKFYIFAAIIYYWLGRNWLLIFLLVAYAIAVFFQMVNIYYPNHLISLVSLGFSKVLSFIHFGWFAAGAMFYIFLKTKENKWFYYGFFSSIVCSAFMDEYDAEFDWMVPVAALAVSTVFAFAIISQKLQLVLNNRFFQIFGFMSYPLYLIHENMMISMIVKIGRHNHFGVPEYLYPLPAIAVLSFIAYVIASYGEKIVKNRIIYPLVAVLK